MRSLNLTHGGLYAHFKPKGGARLKQIEAALSSPNADEQNLVMMSTRVGALVLARSVESDALAARILEMVRGNLKVQANAEITRRKKASQ